MYLETWKLPLPVCRDCATFTADARDALPPGPEGWIRLLQQAVLSLQSFSASSGKLSAAIWADAQPWTDREGKRTALVTLSFTTDAAATRAQIEGIAAPLEGKPWRSDGILARPVDAVPVLATWGGETYRVWQGAFPDPTCASLSLLGAQIKRQVHTYSSLENRYTLPDVRNVIGEPRAIDPETQRKEDQLKMAFAVDVMRRIAAADGEFEDAEKKVLDRIFPPGRLEELWLDDPGLLAMTAREARGYLAGRLGWHEKIALLNAFYAVAYADGTVQIREIQELRAAAVDLGLEATDVAKQIRRGM